MLILIYLGMDHGLAGMSAQDDSTSYPFATRDTLETITVTSNLYWYDLDGNRHTPGDSSREMLYFYPDEKSLIYTDFGDIFTENTKWYSYDLGENGRPMYISAINRYPHQATFYYNTIPMNDPVNGLYNGQFIPVNNIYMVEGDLLTGAGDGTALNVTSHSRHTVAAWSRILYKEGTYYGFTDLDIDFVKPITQNLAFNLGGFNKTFDGSSPDQYFQGSNYRGEVTWQYSPTLYLRGQMFLSRSQVGMRSLRSDLNLQSPRYREARNDYFIDLTWMPRDSTRQRLHLISYYMYTDRKFLDKGTDYKVKKYARRIGIKADYNFLLANTELLLGGDGEVPAGWGSGMVEPYHRYYAATINPYARLKWPLNNVISFEPALRIQYQTDYSIGWDPTLQLKFKPARNHALRFSAGSHTRFPNIDERFFLKDSLSGNSQLIPERQYNFLTEYKYQPVSPLYFQLYTGYTSIQNEVIYKNFTFPNQNDRDFLYIGSEAGFGFWRFNLSLGGHHLVADNAITAKNDIWGRAHFHDIWLKGAIILDAYGTINYFGTRDRMMYEPRLERFYTSGGSLPSYFLVNWKVVATVKDAQLFVEMKNAFSEQYEVVYGYIEYYWKFHFGVNWIFWD